MAHVRTRHPVSMKTDKSQPEQPNDRLVTLVWKSNEKAGRVAHSTRCFSVPMWQPDISGPDRAFIDMLVEAVELRQNAKAHKYVTELLNAGNACLDIPADILEPSAILADYELEQASGEGSRGKLSGEQIAAWFDAILRDTVEAGIAEKQGWLEPSYELTDDNMKKMKQVANGFKACMAKLAAPQPKVDINTAKALQKAVDLLPSEARKKDIIAIKLTKKLDAIINPAIDFGGNLEDML